MKKIKIKNYIRQYIRAFVLVVMIMFFQFGTNNIFLTSMNVSNILIQNYYVLIIAIGMLFIMTTYNIDLSSGIVASLVSGIAGVLIIRNNMPIILTVIVCLFVGALIGALQGFIIEKFNIPSVVVTFISSIILAGVYGVINNNRSLQFPQSFQSLFLKFIPGFMGGKSYRIQYILVVLVVIVFLYFVFSVKTSVGKQLFTPSISGKTDRLAFIKANHVIIFAFINLGILAALAGLITTARLNSCMPISDSSILFDGIAACYIGGASVCKGRGSIGQVIIGVMIISVFNNGMSLIGTSTLLQDSMKIIIIIIAVILDVYNKPKTIENSGFSKEQEHIL